MTRDAEAGFTLIETLVALAVLAVSSVAFLAATEAHVLRIGALETRAVALLAARNYLAEVTLGLEPDARTILLGVTLEVTAQRVRTVDPSLQQIDIAVADAADGRVHARLTGFVREAAEGTP
jgi:general secretion pathway protein I